MQLHALDNPSQVNMKNELNARISFNMFSQAEQSFFMQRSRIRWLSDGDYNTPFSHQGTIARNDRRLSEIFLNQMEFGQLLCRMFMS